MTDLAPEMSGRTISRSLTGSILSGLAVSFVVHAVMLVGLSFIVFKSPLDQLQMIVDSVFTDERAQEDFNQDVEQSIEAAETVNYVAGAMASSGLSTGGTGGPVVAQQKLDEDPFRRLFDLFDRYAIHSGRALIAPYPSPCRLQHIHPVEPAFAQAPAGKPVL